MQFALNSFNQLAIQRMNLDLLLFFQDDDDLVLRVLPPSEEYKLGCLTQAALHNMESVLLDLEKSDLIARVCYEQGVTSRVENRLRWLVSFVALTDVDDSD